MMNVSRHSEFFIQCPRAFLLSQPVRVLSPMPHARLLSSASMRFQDDVLHIGNVSALDLASRFGTPVYVYDSAVIRRQIERVKRAFAALPFLPYFAMKAKGNAAILRLVRGRKSTRLNSSHVEH